MGAEIEDTKSENLEFSQMSNKGHSMTLRNQRLSKKDMTLKDTRKKRQSTKMIMNNSATAIL